MALNQIGGNLPWGGGGANQFMGLGGSASQSLAALGTGYANAYRDALAMNQANYGNILAGYQQTLGANADARNAIGSGYDQLLNDVLGGIGSLGQSRQRDINAQYTQQSGQQAQQLINRGLGNTTVQQSVQRGLQFDQARASNDLAEQIANQTASFRSSLGQAGLGYRERAVAANSADAMRQLDWMNSVNAQYPDAGQYAMLAQQFGAAQQQEQDRRRMLAAAGGNGPPSGGGYVPSGGGMPPLRGGDPAGFNSNLTGFTPAVRGGYGLSGGMQGGGYQPAGIGASAYNMASGAGEGMSSLFAPSQIAAGAGQVFNGNLGSAYDGSYQNYAPSDLGYGGLLGGTDFTGIGGGGYWDSGQGWGMDAEGYAYLD